MSTPPLEHRSAGLLRPALVVCWACLSAALAPSLRGFAWTPLLVFPLWLLGACALYGLRPRSSSRAQQRLLQWCIVAVVMGTSVGVWLTLDRERHAQLVALETASERRITQQLRARLRGLSIRLQALASGAADVPAAEVLRSLAAPVPGAQGVVIWQADGQVWASEPAGLAAGLRWAGAWPEQGAWRLHWTAAERFQLRCRGRDGRRWAIPFVAAELAAGLQRAAAGQLPLRLLPAQAGAPGLPVAVAGLELRLLIQEGARFGILPTGVLPLWSLALGGAGTLLLLLLSRVWFGLRNRRAALLRANQELGEELAAAEEIDRRLRRVFEQAPFGLLLVDVEGQVMGVNERLESMLGYQKGQFIGAEVETVVPEARRETHRGMRAAYTRDPHSRAMGSSLDLEACCADGSHVPVEVSLTPVRDAGGRLQVLAAVRDLRPRLALQAERSAQAARLARSNESLDQFVYVASHDLRAPLDGIRNLREWLQEDNAELLDDAAQAALEAMGADVVQLAERMAALLEYSRAGRIHGKLGVVEVAELLAGLEAELLRPRGARLTLVNEMPVLRSYADPLRSVLAGLLGSCLQLCPEAELDGFRCRVAVFAAAARFEFCIDAPDLPLPAPADRLRVESLSLHDTGLSESGMALPLARRLVEHFGGRIEVEFGAQDGLQFRFDWPREIDPQVSAP